MSSDLTELVNQLKHDIENIDARIVSLKEEGGSLIEQKRKKIVQLAKLESVEVVAEPETEEPEEFI